MKILPYATYTEPTSTYPDELDAAITLLTIEGKRAKGGRGLLGQRAAENVAWVSRFTWPMLALPVNFSAVAKPGTVDDADAGMRRVLLFDLTGLTSSSIAPFRLRDDIDLPAGLMAGDEPSGIAFTTMLANRTAALGAAQKSLPGAITARVRGLMRPSGSGEAVTGFLSGQAGLAKDIIGHLAETDLGDWQGAELARAIDVGEVARVAEEVSSRIEAYLGQAAQVEELAVQLNEAAERYPAELADERDHIRSDYDVQIDVLRPSVEQAIASHQRGLEERLNAITQQYSSTAAAQEAEASKADRDVERFRSLGKDYAGQMAEARRIKQEAQRRLDATNRERDNATKQARTHYRGLIDEENDKLNALIKTRDQEVARIDETERKLEDGLRAFRAAAAKAAEQDRKYAGELADLALPAAAADSAEAFEFGVPFYVARLDGAKTRYLVLGPITVKRTRNITAQISTRLGGLIGTITLPADPRSARYESILAKELTQAVESSAPGEPAAAGVAASVNEKAAWADVLQNPIYRDLALSGLDDLKAASWVPDRRYDEMHQAILRLYGGGDTQ